MIVVLSDEQALFTVSVPPAEMLPAKLAPSWLISMP